MSEQQKLDLRKIDELIATKVMGWKLLNYETGEHEPEAWGDAQNNDGWSWEGQDVSDEAWQWKPTLVAEDAYQVRRKLADRWDWILGSGKTRVDEKPFGFALYHKGRRGKEAFIGEADSECLAVCIVALQSVGIVL